MAVLSLLRRGRFVVAELEGVVIVLVELGVVEQRHAAVLAVLNDGDTASEVARRFGVTRQSVHRWLRQYGGAGSCWVGGWVAAA